MQLLLDKIIESNKKWTKLGNVATYIPELSKANANALGIYVIDKDGHEYFSGDYNEPFTIQSIIKVVTFVCALNDSPISEISQFISFVPSPDAFDSIANLEINGTHRPLNPMINAGAIAMLTFIKGQTYEEKFQRVFDLLRIITDNPELNINKDVYRSESLTGHRNRALAYYMKSTGIIHEEVDELLDIYFRLCSINLNCKDVAKIGAMLSNDGILCNNEEVTSKKICRIVRVVMCTCGMYNESGEFAISVGIPAKSGVSGGILSLSPRKMGIGVFGPALNKNGNSLAGIKVLEELSNCCDLTIY